ncbi:MAG: 2-hydroxyacid dehydrogenase [Tomitella sp.]|nr:2-hydroxyacid dehydrogenase [Tomitella sp.]
MVRPRTRDRAELRALLPDVDIVVGDWGGDFFLGAIEADLAPHLRLIQQPGVGVDFIDVEAWRRVGVPVANTPGANASSVAEWAVIAAGSLIRSMAWAHKETRAGRWPQQQILDRGCFDLGDRRAGIIGFGDVGRRCTALFEAFGCEVAYTATQLHPDARSRYLPLDDLLTRSDVLVVAVPLTEQTRGLISARELGKVPAGSIVINVGRGAVIDESALVDALRTGRIGGAAMDVFVSEPIAVDSPLLTLDRVLLSPHVAGGSSTARRHIYTMAAENVARACFGEAPLRTL